MEILKKNSSSAKIRVFHKQQVMLDRDLAELYCVETKVLNQAVKRNIERFPERYRFQLTEEEKRELVTICDRVEILKHSSSLPYAFTEQGVAMLSAMLHSDILEIPSIQYPSRIAQISCILKPWLLYRRSS